MSGENITTGGNTVTVLSLQLGCLNYSTELGPIKPRVGENCALRGEGDDGESIISAALVSSPDFWKRLEAACWSSEVEPEHNIVNLGDGCALQQSSEFCATHYDVPGSCLVPDVRRTTGSPGGRA